MNRLLPFIVICAALAGCEEPAPPAAPAPPDREPAPQQPEWREVEGSKLRAISEEDREEVLAGAIRNARETMDDARVRWQAATEKDRARWAVLWAAPTSEGGVEYLWVLPATWSEFRIEGALANPPQHELASGRQLDAIVSFPIEEFADWAVFEDESFETVENGGFTLRAIEEISAN